MKFIHTQITGTDSRTRCASPSQSGLSCSTPASWAIATTKTRSKNSSSQVARRSASASSTTRRRGGWRRGAGIAADYVCTRLRRPMRFFEYEARDIIKRAGIPVTDYGFTKDEGEAKEIAERIGGPVVIKSQVLSGGRMKAGGVQFADTPDEAERHARHVLKLEINGHHPRGVLVDPKAQVKQEYYAGVVWDGIRKQPVMLFSDMGGIDIEEVAETHPDHVGRKHFSNLRPVSDFEAKECIAQTGVTGSRLNKLTPILKRLAQLFVDDDMTLAEINPLAEMQDGSFVALDAHMDMENEARPRQKALLHDLGVGDEETRQAREATEFEIA